MHTPLNLYDPMSLRRIPTRAKALRGIADIVQKAVVRVPHTPRRVIPLRSVLDYVPRPDPLGGQHNLAPLDAVQSRRSLAQEALRRPPGCEADEALVRGGKRGEKTQEVRGRSASPPLEPLAA